MAAMKLALVLLAAPVYWAGVEVVAEATEPLVLLGTLTWTELLRTEATEEATGPLVAGTAGADEGPGAWI